MSLHTPLLLEIQRGRTDSRSATDHFIPHPAKNGSSLKVSSGGRQLTGDIGYGWSCPNVLYLLIPWNGSNRSTDQVLISEAVMSAPYHHSERGKQWQKQRLSIINNRS